MLPTLHPADVRAAINDGHKGNPFELFTKDIRVAKKLYDSYNEELYGHVPDDISDSSDTPYDLAETFISEDQEQRDGEY